MSALDDAGDYSSLFVRCNVVNVERGLIHKLDYHQPFTSPMDRSYQDAGWHHHKGLYFDPTRWSVDEIESLRDQCLEVIEAEAHLRELKSQLYKRRDKHKKRPIPQLNPVYLNQKP